MQSRVIVGAVGIAVLVAGALMARVRADAGGVVRLAVQGRANAHPSIAAQGELVAVAWSASLAGGGSDVFAAVSRDGGTTFGTPVQVNTVPGEARGGGEMPPRVVFVPSGTRDDEPGVLVLWRARGAASAIRAARSRDGGRRFEPAVDLQAPDAAGDRGWHTAAVDAEGRVHAIWLDHRGLASAGGGAHAAHRKGADAGFDGVAMAQRSGLYYADTFAPAVERELVKGVCYCCKTALATGPAGAVYAAWRQVYDGNIRDIAFIASHDGGRSFGSPSRVSEDRWQLAGCPDDGPAMAVDAAGIVHLVWPTVVGGDAPEGALFYASTRDGRTFTPRLRVPTLGSPKPSHPQIARAPDGRLVIGWDELHHGVRTAAATTLEVDGASARFGPVLSFSDQQEAGAYPMFASTTRGTIAVWTAGTGESSTIAVRPLDLASRSGSR